MPLDRFQYPLRVEVGCNQVNGCRRSHAARVSVPSTGRSGLQQKIRAMLGRKPASFSTLYGSKWVATENPRHARAQASEFQYPLRVEVGCNLGRIAPPALLNEVSVPSTGRSGLQPSSSGGGRAEACRFSTLYGSKWVATPGVN